MLLRRYTSYRQRDDEDQHLHTLVTIRVTRDGARHLSHPPVRRWRIVTATRSVALFLIRRQLLFDCRPDFAVAEVAVAVSTLRSNAPHGRLNGRPLGEICAHAAIRRR